MDGGRWKRSCKGEKGENEDGNEGEEVKELHMNL